MRLPGQMSLSVAWERPRTMLWRSTELCLAAFCPVSTLFRFALLARRDVTFVLCPESELFLLLVRERNVDLSHEPRLAPPNMIISDGYDASSTRASLVRFGLVWSGRVESSRRLSDVCVHSSVSVGGV